MPWWDWASAGGPPVEWQLAGWPVGGRGEAGTQGWGEVGLEGHKARTPHCGEWKRHRAAQRTTMEPREGDPEITPQQTGGWIDRGTDGPVTGAHLQSTRKCGWSPRGALERDRRDCGGRSGRQ